MPLGCSGSISPEHRGELRQEHVQQAHLAQQEERRQRVAAAEHLRELLGDARRRGLGDLLPVAEDRLVSVAA